MSLISFIKNNKHCGILCTTVYALTMEAGYNITCHDLVILDFEGIFGSFFELCSKKKNTLKS